MGTAAVVRALPHCHAMRHHMPAGACLPIGLSSPRIRLAPFLPSDAPALFEFMRDADAMSHTYVAPSLAHCASRLGAYEALRSSLGFAPWVVRVATDGQIVGWGGLSVDPEEPAWGLEVSYAFARTAWGRGYATELVALSLAHAFGQMAAPEVHAFAKPQNAASIRVLAKCGFTRLRFEPALQRDHYLVKAQR